MTEKRLQSLAAIFEEAREERAAQLRHFDALDVKAGIVLGFSGALVALAPVANALADVGRFVAVTSGVFAVMAFWPRRYWATNLRTLRDLYLGSDPVFTRIRVLDTQILMAETVGATLNRKAFLLKLAMIGLVVAASLPAVGLPLD